MSETPHPPRKNSAVTWLICLLAILVICGVAYKVLDGSTSLLSRGIAAASNSNIPNWVPVYPGAKIENVVSRPGRVELYTSFQITTADSCKKVFDYYEQKLNLAGYHVVRSDRSTSDGCSGVLQSEGPGHTRSISLTGGNTATAVRFGVEVVQRDTEGRSGASQNPPRNAGQARIPDWLPVYPGSTPSNMVPQQSESEYHLSFSFTSGDSVRKVLSWYQEKLKAAGLKADMDVVGDARGALWSNNRDNTRSAKIEGTRAGSQNVFTLDVMDR